MNRIPEPHPTKVALFSAQDIPVVRGDVPPLWSVPAVVEVEGVWMRLRVSEFVPAGQVYVFDPAALEGVSDVD